MEHITLYYRQGSSDKIYQAYIEESGGGFIVNFAFGRRGTTLQSGTKTATPVPFADAKKIFDKLASKSRDSLHLIDSTIVKAHRAASGAKGGSKIRRSASVAAVAPRKSTPSSIARAAR